MTSPDCTNMTPSRSAAAYGVTTVTGDAPFITTAPFCTTVIRCSVKDQVVALVVVEHEEIWRPDSRQRGDELHPRTRRDAALLHDHEVPARA